MSRITRKKKENQKISISLDINIIGRFISYALDTTSMVKNRGLMNLKKFTDTFSLESKDNTGEEQLMFDILYIIIHKMVDDSIRDYVILKDAVSNDPLVSTDSEYVKQVMDYYLEIGVTEEDIHYLEDIIGERLTYAFFYQRKEELKSLIVSLESGESPRSINDRLEPLIGNLHQSIRNVKATQKEAMEDFCIGTPSFKNSFQEAVKDAKRPNNKIKTGIQGLNTMINGGYENGRVYTYLALPKCGKSMMLLNSGIWACKYSEFQPKDPSKIPTVLYVTMENTKRESIERIYTYVTGDSLVNIPDDGIENAMNKINNELIGDRNVCFEIKYRSYKSINTDDLDRMVDELNSDGKEVVMIILDYIKRIRSVENKQDIRLDLGDIINELATIAKSRDIPVLTASQLNR